MSKPIDSPYIAWFDLETTGNQDDDRIIEVGFVLTDRDLNEVEALKEVVYPRDWSALRQRMADVVVDMHTANGLLLDVSLAHQMIADVDGRIAGMLKSYGKGQHIPFAGSGVAHFDRRYIRREMPQTDDMLSYWAYDIGSLRRLLYLFGIETPGSDLRLSKTHRALDDIREHIAEAKVIRDTLRENAELAWQYKDLQ